MGKDEEVWPKLFKKAAAHYRKGNCECCGKKATNLACLDGSNVVGAFLVLHVRWEHNLPDHDIPVFSSKSNETHWKLPRTVPDAGRINCLLEHSMATQMSSLPGTEFDECFLSGDCLTVSGFIHLYLNRMGIRSDLHTGILKLGENSLPWVWLTIKGHVIDNTYIFWPGGKPGEIDTRLLNLKKFASYSEQDPAAASFPLDLDLGRKTSTTDPRLMRAYATPKKIHQYILFRCCFARAYPELYLYDMGMEKASYNLIESRPKDWAEKDAWGYLMKHRPKDWADIVELHCWNCRERKEHLLRCGDCQLALYCDADCQKADWQNAHKLLHKDLEVNTWFQIEKAEERAKERAAKMRRLSKGQARQKKASQKSR